MRPTLVLATALSLCFAGRASGQCAPPPPDSGRATAASVPFQDEIEQFEAADKANPPPTGGVVFVGSSSIRLWPNLKADFPEANVLQRGFGGSELWQVLYYAPRIVLRYCPKRIVVYAGENDLVAGRSPEQVLADYRDLVALVRQYLPSTEIAFIAIKPSESRWALADRMLRTNQLVREFSSGDPRLVYIDAYTPMLGPNGRPRRDLFVADSLHMSADGYALWRGLVAGFVYGHAASSSNPHD
jgi:lysophospholipase L1-like esterase